MSHYRSSEKRAAHSHHQLTYIFLAWEFFAKTEGIDPQTFYKQVLRIICVIITSLKRLPRPQTLPRSNKQYCLEGFTTLASDAALDDFEQTIGSIWHYLISWAQNASAVPSFRGSMAEILEGLSDLMASTELFSLVLRSAAEPGREGSGLGRVDVFFNLKYLLQSLLYRLGRQEPTFRKPDCRAKLVCFRSSHRGTCGMPASYFSSFPEKLQLLDCSFSQSPSLYYKVQ